MTTSKRFTVRHCAAVGIATAWSLAGIAFADQSTPPALDSAATGGWRTIAGGPGTGCATDATPFEFYVREGDERKLAIYFEGGGACWTSRNCGLDGRRTFDHTIEDADRPWIKSQATGIFDVDNPANPLRGYTIVMAPYCSADLHMGVGTVRYEAGGKHLDIHYRGLANSQSVMDWVTHHYTRPKQIFVAGGSAGAIPSPIFAAQLARHYSKAKVVQLGDGAGGYRSVNVSSILELWGATRALKYDPLFQDLEVATANFEDFYSRVTPLKNLQLAQVNSVEDSTQIFFLGELGHKVTSLAPLLSGNLADVRKVNPELLTYTMPGAVHTILQRPEFYTVVVDNAPLSKWVSDLIAGDRPKSVGDALLTSGTDRLK